MKRQIFFVFLIGILVGSLFPSPMVLGEAISKNIEVFYNPLKIMVDRVEKESEKKPFVFEGTTYVPLRFISEALGKNVYYDSVKEAIWIGSQPGDKANNLLELKEKNASSTIIFPNEVTMYDLKKYENGLVFLTLRDGISYDLRGQYVSLSGIVGPTIDYTGNEKSYLVIYGDGKELYRTQEFVGLHGNSGSLPMRFKVDITDVKTLTIQLEGGNTKLGLMDAIIWN